MPVPTEGANAGPHGQECRSSLLDGHFLDNYHSLVTSSIFHADLQPRARQVVTEFLSPLDQHDGVFHPEVIQAEGFELRQSIEAVEIDVVDLRVPFVFVDQGERRAEDVFRAGRSEAFDEAFGKRCLAGSQISDQQDQFWGLESSAEATPQLHGFLRGRRLVGLLHSLLVGSTDQAAPSFIDISYFVSVIYCLVPKVELGSFGTF